jgi:hypothetical protein
MIKIAKKLISKKFLHIKVLKIVASVSKLKRSC